MAGDSKKESGVIFQVTATGLVWYVVPLPMIGGFLCVALSLIFNFDESTTSACGNGESVRMSSPICA